MLKKFALSIIAIACLAGCAESGSAIRPGSGKTHKIDTCEGMIEYLQRAGLPALKSGRLSRRI